MDQDLKVVQSHLLKMMNTLSEFFDKENIQYVAVGGTVLGAYRHSGFIPWDDDIDLAVPYDDFNRLIAMADSLPEGMTLQCFPTEPRYHLFFAKIKLDGTVYVENRFEHSDIHPGLFIDVFPLYKNNTKEENDAIIPLSNKFSRCVKPYQGVIGKVKSLVYKTIYPAPEVSYQLVQKQLSKHNDEPAVSWSSMYHQDSFLDEDVFPPRKLDFDGIPLNVPCNVEKYLENKYGGDYMTPPPIEQRIPHQVVKVKL
ncbi:LicD family protein [Vibrio astriarenae]